MGIIKKLVELLTPRDGEYFTRFPYKHPHLNITVQSRREQDIINCILYGDRDYVDQLIAHAELRAAVYPDYRKGREYKLINSLSDIRAILDARQQVADAKAIAASNRFWDTVRWAKASFILHEEFMSRLSESIGDVD